MSPATGDEPKDVTDPAPARPRQDRYPLSTEGTVKKSDHAGLRRHW